MCLRFIDKKRESKEDRDGYIYSPCKGGGLGEQW